MINAILVRFGEIFLKKMRKKYFLDRLLANTQRALKGIDGVRVRAPYGRILITLGKNEDGSYPPLEHRQGAIEDALSRVFGIESFSPMVLCEPEMEILGGLCRDLAIQELERRPDVQTFKVDTNRADKRFPMKSPEVNPVMGGYVLEALPDLRVNLTQPDLLVGIELHRDFSGVFATTHRGGGGLPVSSSGKALLLLSGGIDSPVAGWRTMKRGVHVDSLYFHAFPYTGDQTKRKVMDLARQMARWQNGMKLHVAEFGAFQKHCAEKAPGRLLVLLYRRQMMRVAEHIALGNGYPALVTGEAIGQVASQTLDNLWAISTATQLPIVRPLVTDDKKETILDARRIGTYDISIQPFDDCCSLFVPKHPEVRGNPAQLEEAETLLEWESHLEEIISGIEVIQIR